MKNLFVTFILYIVLLYIFDISKMKIMKNITSYKPTNDTASFTVMVEVMPDFFKAQTQSEIRWINVNAQTMGAANNIATIQCKNEYVIRTHSIFLN
jgi:hypothetical protein